MTTRVGIDFGTANTVVARWDERLMRGVPIAVEGIDLHRSGGQSVTQRVIPSLIAYAAADGGFRHWIGAQVGPDLTGHDGVAVFQYTKSNVTGRTVDVPVKIGGAKVSARQAATRFLGDVMALTVLTLDVSDVEIVATAPVEAFEDYRDWLAGEVAAGLAAARLRVVDEATAAAVGYAARMNPGDAFCVFDFGAGTLDVAVVRIVAAESVGSGPAVRIVAKTGIDLGGNDIDLRLAHDTAEQLGLQNADPLEYNRLFRELLTSAEAAKVALTTGERARVGLVSRPDGVEVTRHGFERMLREHHVLSRAGQALRRTLDQSAARGYPASSLAGVFLVGGTCLIPAVQELVLTQFDAELIHLDRPLEAVAAGAAGIAGGYELHDHIQHDYAIRYSDPATGAYRFEPLVEAGTEYPTPDPVRTLTIQAVRDGQQNLGIAIYELAHATSGGGSPADRELEIVFDGLGGARAVPVTPQKRTERAQRWLNETTPTFLHADPPAVAGADRFQLDFHIDAQRRLTVSAFDLERRIWILDRRPVVKLA